MDDMPEYLKRKNDNYLNSLELKETIKNFLVDYDNTAHDFMSRADYDLWMETAINLLQQCVVDDYKIIPQDQD